MIASPSPDASQAPSSSQIPSLHSHPFAKTINYARAHRNTIIRDTLYGAPLTHAETERINARKVSTIVRSYDPLDDSQLDGRTNVGRRS